MLEQVDDSLKVRDLLPAEHLVDKGYTHAHVLVHSQRQHGVMIAGPVAEDPGWQARGGGFDKGGFIVDWERRVVTCPAGKQSIFWLPNSYLRNGVVFEARFARKDCAACPHRARCTRSKLEARAPLARGRKPKSSGANTLLVPLSRERMNKPSGAAACGNAVTSGRPKQAFSMS